MSRQTTQTEDEPTVLDRHRRKLLVGLAGLGAAGMFGAGSATAQNDPAGTVGTEDNPFRRAYIDRQIFIGRSDDPSAPDDGTTWYRGDL